MAGTTENPRSEPEGKTLVYQSGQSGTWKIIQTEEGFVVGVLSLEGNWRTYEEFPSGEGKSAARMAMDRFIVSIMHDM